MRTVDDVIHRLRAEFVEMPGMRLTRAQIQRLCGLELVLCQAVLDSLVEANFLKLSPDGRYGRVADGDVVRPRPARAALRDEARPLAS